MSNELIIPGDPTPLLLPPAKTKGATALLERLSSLLPLLPQGLDPKAFIFQALVEANKLHADVWPNSVCTAVLNAACIGLPLGPALGHAYLVPFRKGKEGPRICQLIVGYKGYLDLAYGCDFLADVQAEVVLNGEHFSRWNNAEGAQIEHKLPVERDPQWPAVVAAYCIWHSKAGGHGISMVGRRELCKLHSRGNVWHTHPIPMCLKTTILRAAAGWRKTNRMAQAMALNAMAEAGEPQSALVPEEEAERPKLADIPEPEDGADGNKA